MGVSWTKSTLRWQSTEGLERTPTWSIGRRTPRDARSMTTATTRILTAVLTGVMWSSLVRAQAGVQRTFLTGAGIHPSVSGTTTIMDTMMRSQRREILVWAAQPTSAGATASTCGATFPKSDPNLSYSIDIRLFKLNLYSGFFSALKSHS